MDNRLKERLNWLLFGSGTSITDGSGGFMTCTHPEGLRQIVILAFAQHQSTAFMCLSCMGFLGELKFDRDGKLIM